MTIEVLLIEDHALLRSAMVLALRQEDFVPHDAGSVPEAMRLLAAHPGIVAAIFEIEFGPGQPDGFAFAAEARALRPDLGLLVLTGRADRLVGRVAGPREAFLTKPCPMSQVVRRLRQLLAPR